MQEKKNSSRNSPKLVLISQNKGTSKREGHKRKKRDRGSKGRIPDHGNRKTNKSRVAEEADRKTERTLSFIP